MTLTAMGTLTIETSTSTWTRSATPSSPRSWRLPSSRISCDKTSNIYCKALSSYSRFSAGVDFVLEILFYYYGYRLIKVNKKRCFIERLIWYSSSYKSNNYIMLLKYNYMVLKQNFLWFRKSLHQFDLFDHITLSFLCILC